MITTSDQEFYTVTYYHRQWRCWVAFYNYVTGDQAGPCGYGNTKTRAIDDLKYQHSITQS